MKYPMRFTYISLIITLFNINFYYFLWVFYTTSVEKLNSLERETETETDRGKEIDIEKGNMNWVVMDVGNICEEGKI